jgi:hypothetical protein
VAVSGRSRGQLLQVTGGMMTGWVMTGWLSLSTRNYGPGDSDSRQLTESATEKRNPAGQIEYGWSRARARRAPLEDDWMGS